MRRTIQSIQQKTDLQRKRLAIWISGTSTIVIAIIWLAVLPTQMQQDVLTNAAACILAVDRSQQGDSEDAAPGPFATLRDSVANSVNYFRGDNVANPLLQETVVGTPKETSRPNDLNNRPEYLPDTKPEYLP